MYVPLQKWLNGYWFFSCIFLDHSVLLCHTVFHSGWRFSNTISKYLSGYGTTLVIYKGLKLYVHCVLTGENH